MSAKISQQALEEIRLALTEYRIQVRSTAMKDSTKKTYLLHASNFVRWLANDFVPGGRVSVER